MRSKISVLLFAGLLGLNFAASAWAHELTNKTASPMLLAPAARLAAVVVDRFHAALQRGDTQAAASLLSEDALVFESGGVERSKGEYAAQHLASDAAFARATTHAITRRTGALLGDSAWVATEGLTKGIFNDRVINSVSTETMILQRRSGVWRIVHIHWSSGKAKT